MDWNVVEQQAEWESWVHRVRRGSSQTPLPCPWLRCWFPSFASTCTVALLLLAGVTPPPHGYTRAVTKHTNNYTLMKQVFDFFDADHSKKISMEGG